MFFQDIILSLVEFWTENANCSFLQPFDIEVGAGTSHPATLLHTLTQNPWNVVYVQPCRRPTDGRYGMNPNRNQYYYQMQVILKPSPDDVQDLCLKSLQYIGINLKENDLRFVECNWKNDTVGAWGLGWELRCNGMEVLQFTYMQQLCGEKCFPVPCEITYGLERIAMAIQNVDNIFDIIFSGNGLKYGDIHKDWEKSICHFSFEYSNVEMLYRHFTDYISESNRLIEISKQKIYSQNTHDTVNLVAAAYEYCIKACHLFNLLDARKVMNVIDRASYMSTLREISLKCAQEWILLKNNSKSEYKNI